MPRSRLGESGAARRFFSDCPAAPALLAVGVVTSEPEEAPPPPPEDGPEAEVPQAPAEAPAPRSPWQRRVQVSLLLAGGAAVVAVYLCFVRAAPSGDEASAGTAVASAAVPLSHPAEATGTQIGDARASSVPAADADEPVKNDHPPRPDKPGKHTVEWVSTRACSTAQIDGLSRQIVAEARCIDANAFARVPGRKNLESEGHVFLYLDAPARDHLLRVLDAHPKRIMKVHSALRTVAQQYLLSRWAAGKRCGIQLANRPGTSNHETGLALDISAHAEWRTALEGEGFRWLGASDRVHFDFVGPGAVHHDGLDVMAFQRLWNRNHPDDTISETGRYDPATEQRLKKSPAAGFPVGARCARGQDVRHASNGGSTQAHAR